MATNRSWRTREARETLSADLRTRLLTGDSTNSLEVFLLGDDELRKAWEENREELLADHVRKSPGTRPWSWWKFDAPEPRRRTGGKGEVLGGHPSTLQYGLPHEHDFLTAWLAEIFNSLHPEDVREYEVYDKNDPPRYESQASFLERLDLLLPGEEARLTETDFADERIDLARSDDDE